MSGYSYARSTVKKREYLVCVRPHLASGTGNWGSGPAAVTASTGIVLAGAAVTETWADAAIDSSAPPYFLNPADAQTSIAKFVQIGMIETGPVVNASLGEELQGSDGLMKKISESLETSFNDVNFSADNYKQLRALAGGLYVDDALVTENVDILFYDPYNAAASIGVSNVPLTVLPNIQSNGVNRIALSAKFETADIDNRFGIIAVS